MPAINSCPISRPSVRRTSMTTSPPNAGSSCRFRAPFFLSGVAQSDVALVHLVGNVIRLPDRQRDDGERRILRRAGGELAAVRDEKVFHVMGLPVTVAHTVARAGALPACAHVMSRRKRHARVNLGRAGGLV